MYSILALQGLEIATYFVVLILLLTVLSLYFREQFLQLRLPLIAFMSSMVLSLSAREIVFVVIYVGHRHVLSKPVNSIPIS